MRTRIAMSFFVALSGAGCGQQKCLPLDDVIGCPPPGQGACGCPATWVQAQNPASWGITGDVTCPAGPYNELDELPVLSHCASGSYAFRQFVDTGISCEYDSGGRLVRAGYGGLVGNTCYGTDPMQLDCFGPGSTLCTPPQCDAITGSPCLAGEKCTWIPWL